MNMHYFWMALFSVLCAHISLCKMRIFGKTFIFWVVYGEIMVTDLSHQLELQIKETNLRNILDKNGNWSVLQNTCTCVTR